MLSPTINSMPAKPPISATRMRQSKRSPSSSTPSNAREHGRNERHRDRIRERQAAEREEERDGGNGDNDGTRAVEKQGIAGGPAGPAPRGIDGCANQAEAETQEGDLQRGIARGQRLDDGVHQRQQALSGDGERDEAGE